MGRTKRSAVKARQTPPSPVERRRTRSETKTTLLDVQQSISAPSSYTSPENHATPVDMAGIDSELSDVSQSDTEQLIASSSSPSEQESDGEITDMCSEDNESDKEEEEIDELCEDEFAANLPKYSEEEVLAWGEEYGVGGHAEHDKLFLEGSVDGHSEDDSEHDFQLDQCEDEKDLDYSPEETVTRNESTHVPDYAAEVGSGPPIECIGAIAESNNESDINEPQVYDYDLHMVLQASQSRLEAETFLNTPFALEEDEELLDPAGVENIEFFNQEEHGVVGGTFNTMFTLSPDGGVLDTATVQIAANVNQEEHVPESFCDEAFTLNSNEYLLDPRNLEVSGLFGEATERQISDDLSNGNIDYYTLFGIPVPESAANETFSENFGDDVLPVPGTPVDINHPPENYFSADYSEDLALGAGELYHNDWSMDMTLAISQPDELDTGIQSNESFTGLLYDSEVDFHGFVDHPGLSASGSSPTGAITTPRTSTASLPLPARTSTTHRPGTATRRPRTAKAIAAEKASAIVTQTIAEEDMNSNAYHNVVCAPGTDSNGSHYQSIMHAQEEEVQQPQDHPMSGFEVQQPLSVVVPDLPTAGPSTKAKRPRTSRTKAAKAAREAAAVAASAEVERNLAMAQVAVNASITTALLGPVVFSQGPHIEVCNESRTHGNLLVTEESASSMPPLIQKAFWDRVSEIQKLRNGTSLAITRRRQGIKVPCINLPELPPHDCDICDRKFDLKWDLTKHYKAKHPGARVFCKECNMTFTRNYSLLMHNNDFHAHLIKFKCFCGEVFTRGNTLARHQKKCEAHTTSNPMETTDPAPESPAGPSMSKRARPDSQTTAIELYKEAARIEKEKEEAKRREEGVKEAEVSKPKAKKNYKGKGKAREE